MFKKVIKYCKIIINFVVIFDAIKDWALFTHQFDYVLINNLQQVKPAITQGRILQEAISYLLLGE